MIDSFQDIYAFMSNFHNAPVIYEGVRYANSESAFQAQKCPERRHEFINIPPGIAKKMGRQCKIRADWEEVKDQIMYEIVFAKFAQNPDIAKKLVETGKEPIVEGNWWHDNYWGDCKCDRCKNMKGKNMLGKILMVVRHEFATRDLL